MNEPSKRVIGGVLGGLVATAVMSAQLVAEPSVRKIGTPPPRRLADVLLPHRSDADRSIAATVIHLGIGAAGGLAYRTLVRRRYPGVGSGMLFGLVIWVAGYQVVMPALGVLPPAHRDQPGRRAALIEAHLVYGAVLGALG